MRKVHFRTVKSLGMWTTAIAAAPVRGAGGVATRRAWPATPSFIAGRRTKAKFKPYQDDYIM